MGELLAAADGDGVGCAPAPPLADADAERGEGTWPVDAAELLEAGKGAAEGQEAAAADAAAAVKAAASAPFSGYASNCSWVSGRTGGLKLRSVASSIHVRSNGLVAS